MRAHTTSTSLPPPPDTVIAYNFQLIGTLGLKPCSICKLGPRRRGSAGRVLFRPVQAFPLPKSCRHEIELHSLRPLECLLAYDITIVVPIMFLFEGRGTCLISPLVTSPLMSCSLGAHESTAVTILPLPSLSVPVATAAQEWPAPQRI